MNNRINFFLISLGIWLVISLIYNFFIGRIFDEPDSLSQLITEFFYDPITGYDYISNEPYYRLRLPFVGYLWLLPIIMLIVSGIGWVKDSKKG